jgi:hypothetical protein
MDEVIRVLAYKPISGSRWLDLPGRIVAMVTYAAVETRLETG